MANIEKRYAIDSGKLSGALYFESLLREAYMAGLLSDHQVENIQLQSMRLLADQCDKYHAGSSSSIRIETAESIMNSNLYTIGLYLKSFPHADVAANEINTTMMSDLYEKGRKLLDAKVRSAKHLFNLVQKNKIMTINDSYNSTLGENGIGLFFQSYNREFEAHETPAAIDYQLCLPVDDLAGVEYIDKYLQNLFRENEFCLKFKERDIHQLLSGYDRGYKDLLINIFELVLGAALGCVLADRKVRDLKITSDDIIDLQEELSKDDQDGLKIKIYQAAKKMLLELNIDSISLRNYVQRSLPRMMTTINQGLQTRTLDRVFILPLDRDNRPAMQYLSDVKMADENYRNLIEELIACRHFTDKLAMIKETVKSFDDLEEVLLDACLSPEEIILLLDTLKEIEIAEMIRRHPYGSDIQAVDLSKAEQTLQACLEHYMRQIAEDKRHQIIQIADNLMDG